MVLYKQAIRVSLNITLLLTAAFAMPVNEATSKLLIKWNPQCSVYYLAFRNYGSLNSISGMLNMFEQSAMPVGIINPNQTWHRLKYIPKLRNPCQFVLSSLIDINGESSNFPSDFQEITQSHDDHDGIVMRNKDYFIFITNSMELTSNILLSNVGKLLRYKVALHQSTLNGSHLTSVVTVNPYMQSTFSMNGGFPWERIINIATFASSSTLNESVNIFMDFTWNFHGYPMKMSTLDTQKPAYEVVTDPSSAGNVIAKRGYFANLTETIHAKLNMSVIISPCRGGGKFPAGIVSGLKLPNSTWIGCMGDVIYNRVDISMAAPVLNRFPYVDFLPRHKYVFIKFVSRQPTKNVSWTAFYNAFRPLVWGLLLASIFVMTVLIWIGMRIKFDAQVHLGATFYDQMRILLCQDANYPSDGAGISTGTVFILSLFCSLILGTAYNSKLTALMTIPEIEPDFPTDFKSLSTTTHFKVGAEKAFLDSIGGVIFKKSTSPAIHNIFERMERDDGIESCMQRALISNYACVSFNFYHDFETGVVFADSRGIGPFFESSDMFNFLPLTQVVRKREIFQESYGYFLQNAFEMGLIDKWAIIDMLKLRLELFNNVSDRIKYNDEIESVKALTISNFLGSFVILTTGSLVSLIVLLFEICLRRSVIV